MQQLKAVWLLAKLVDIDTRELSGMANAVSFECSRIYFSSRISSVCLDCGNAIDATQGVLATLSDCNTPCNGNTTEMCGGPSRLSVFNYTGIIDTTSTNNNGGTGAGGGPTGGTTGTTDVALPGNWAYKDCYVYAFIFHYHTLQSHSDPSSDNAYGRIFEVNLGGSSTNTVKSCVSRCAAQNYTVAGMEFAVRILAYRVSF
jgi:hypothetical protein